MQEQLVFNDEIAKFKTLADLLEDVVYRNSKMSAGEIAAALDLSPSELTRMIRHNDYADEYRRNFPLAKLPLLLEVTEDYRLIHWLNYKYLVPEEAKRRVRLEKLERTLPIIEAALKEIKGFKRGK
jgi:hypothetical protein